MYTYVVHESKKNRIFETGTAAAVPVFIIGRIQFHGAFIFTKQRSPRGGAQCGRLLRFSGKRYERTRDVRKKDEYRGRGLRLLPVSHAPSRLAFRPERRGDLPLLSEADPMDRPFPAPLSGRKNAPWSLSPEAADAAERLSGSELILQGIATSIDALSVGFTSAAYSISSALLSSLIISAITYLLCSFGIRVGRKFGTALSRGSSVLGGLILILIGLEIFLSASS